MPFVTLKEGGENDWILVRVDPTSKMSTVSMMYPLHTIVITRKDSSTVQRCGLRIDSSVPGDDSTPEETSYVFTVKVQKGLELRVQIDPPFDDHTSEVVLALRVISLATPPVWISQIMMAVLEVQAMERPSGE